MAERPWTVYLAGEIHSDWRERIIAGAEAAELPIEFTTPVCDHASSDDCGAGILGDEEKPFWKDHKGAKINAIRTRTLIQEADVVFDADVAWSTSKSQATKSAYGGSRRPWGTTAIHEMGHALGLAHEDDTYNVMGQDWDHIHAMNGVVRWYVGEDAGNGEVHLYGKTNTTRKNDLGVTHWKHSGSHKGYSTHTECRIYKLDDSPVTRVDFNGWKRYNVQNGNIYKVQFTYENNGYYDQKAVDIAYYISTDDCITIVDRLIGLATFDMNRNKAFTLAIHLRIPEDLTVGQTYYIGVIVDYQNTLLEFDHGNNATWIPIRIIKEMVWP